MVMINTMFLDEAVRIAVSSPAPQSGMPAGAHGWMMTPSLVTDGGHGNQERSDRPSVQVPQASAGLWRV